MSDVIPPSAPSPHSIVARVTASPRLVAALIFAISTGALISALMFEYLGGLLPCILCLYQRVIYVVALVLSGMIFFLSGAMGTRAASSAIGLSALIFLSGASVSGFHVGVEQGWWSGTQTCGTTIDPNLPLAELKARLLAQPMVRCDEVPWSLFGISMAGYNFLASLIFASASLLAAYQLDEGEE